MAAQHVNTATLRVCGHTDKVSFDTRKAARMRDTIYFTNTLCHECCRAIKALTESATKGFFRIEQPTLVGTERQIYRAKQHRLSAMRTIGPVMGSLSKSSDPFAQVALAAYVMLFKITSAKFWIETSNFPYNSSWVTNEIEAMLRKAHTSMKPGERSAYGYWTLIDRSVISEAKAALPALLDALHTAEKATA